MIQEIRSEQQGDGWLRARCGRITGSKLPDVCDFVAKGSMKRGDKSVLPGSKRTKYRRAVMGERLTGLLANHWYSEYMARGEREEEPARMFYKAISDDEVIPVSFVAHPDLVLPNGLSYSGASADGLIGKEGVLEIKNPSTEVHLSYWEDGYLPEDYVPQCAWEMASAGKERRFVDFLSLDRRIQDRNFCYFLKRTGRDELEWEVPILTTDGKVERRKLTGESVIDYFTDCVVSLNAEIMALIAERGDGKTPPIAPFPLDLKEDAKRPAEPHYATADEAMQAAADLIDSLEGGMTP